VHYWPAWIEGNLDSARGRLLPAGAYYLLDSASSLRALKSRTLPRSQCAYARRLRGTAVARLRQLNIRGAWLGAALWALHPIMVPIGRLGDGIKKYSIVPVYLLSIFCFLKWQEQHG